MVLRLRVAACALAPLPPADTAMSPLQGTVCKYMCMYVYRVLYMLFNISSQVLQCITGGPCTANEEWQVGPLLPHDQT